MIFKVKLSKEDLMWQVSQEIEGIETNLLKTYTKKFADQMVELIKQDLEKQKLKTNKVK